MAENSKIAWTDDTFNPWMGCTKVDAACASCYAENLMDLRYGKVEWGPNGTRMKTTDSYWRKPIAWNKAAEKDGVRRKVFCASLADVFEDWQGPILNSAGEELSICGGCGKINPQRVDCGGTEPLCERVPRKLTMHDLRRDLFRLIDATPHLDWLLLTKRPENVLRMWPQVGYPDAGVPGTLGRRLRFENAWPGTSVGAQDQMHRWETLSQLADLFPVLWVSAEPLLGPLDFSGCKIKPHWVVFGGESDQAKAARPCNIEWIRSGVEQCRELGIVPFVKQLGSRPIDHGTHFEWPEGTAFRADPTEGNGCRVILKDKAGVEPSEWPSDVAIREFPLEQVRT